VQSCARDSLPSDLFFKSKKLSFFHPKSLQEVRPPLSFFFHFIFGGSFRFCLWYEEVQEMRELSIPTRKTNPSHNDVPENTTFLLLDQPSGEANTTGTLINKIDEVAINAKTANWKTRVMLLILQDKIPTNYTI